MNTSHSSSPPRSHWPRGFAAGASHALLFAALCLGPGKAAAQTGMLIHEWGFDGDGTDVAGGNTATVYGAATFATTGGLFGGGCLICPASLTDYASATYFPPPGTADNGTTGTRSYTVSAWVNMGGANTTRDAMVFAWGQNGTNGFSEQGITTRNGQVGHGRWDGVTWQSSFVGSIPASNWHLLANTVSGNTVSQYIDGVLVGTTSITNTPNTGQILMGNLNWAGGYQFGGTRKIDDIAVWSSPLSPGKVAAMNNALSVNGGSLSDYNAGRMAVLFQVYDDGNSQSVASTAGDLTWTKFTDVSGTAGQVTYNAGTYQAWFTATDGVQANVFTYTITPSAGTGGTITPSDPVVVGQGASQSFTITADVGYAIDQVLVDGVNDETAVTTGSYTFSNVTGDHTIAATFASTDTWTITVTQGANGTITPDPAIVNNGANQTFTIAPNSRYQIADVLVDGVSVGAVGSYTFTNVTADGHTITATFAPVVPLVDVNLASVGGGDVTSIPNGGSLGGNFTVDGTGTAPVVTIVGSKKAIQLNLTGTTLLLNDAAPTPDSVLGITTGRPVYTILATVFRPDFNDAPDGCIFASFAPYQKGANFAYGNTPWLANHWTAGATMTVDNPTFYNTYAPAGSWHTLLFTSDGTDEKLYIDGDTTARATSGGPTSFANGNNRYPIRLGGTDYDNGTGLDWLYQGAIGSLQIWSIPTSAEDVPAVTAAIAPLIPTTHTITASADTGGTISPSGAVAVLDGDSQAFTITADVGYAIAQVLVDDVNDPDAVASGNYTFSNVTGDHTIAATFVNTQTWTIAVTQVANGTISPDPAIVNNGASLTLAITPNPRYQIADVLVDGGSVGAVGSYTFTNVTADGHTISATYAAIAPLVDVNLASVGGGDVTSIPNGGSLGGNFIVDGTGTAPIVAIVGSKKAIQLNLTGTTLLLNGAAATPNSVLGLNGSGGAGTNPVYTILATVYRPDFVDDPNGCLFASFAPYRYGAGFAYGNTPWLANHWMAGATMTVDNPSFYNTNAPAGSWHTLLFTSDGSSEKLYIDGAITPVATTTGPTSFHNEYNNNRYPIRLGGSDMGDGTGLLGLYNGAIGSLQIWSIPTAAEDVQAVTAAIAPITPTNTHTVTASAGAGGTISPSGDMPVLDAGSQAFTITANPGYVIQDVLVDGASNPGAVSTGSYTFTNVTGPHTISATFTATVADPYADWRDGFDWLAFTDPDMTPTGDPDGDGMSNQQEFAFGLDPTKGSSVNPITAPLDMATGKFSYTRYAASGLSYHVFTSTDLLVWAEEAYPVNETASDPDPSGVVTVEVTVAALPANGKLFVRVAAQEP